MAYVWRVCQCRVHTFSFDQTCVLFVVSFQLLSSNNHCVCGEFLSPGFIQLWPELPFGTDTTGPTLLCRRVFPSQSINVFVVHLPGGSNPSFANNLGEDAGSSYECQKCIGTKMIIVCKDYFQKMYSDKDCDGTTNVVMWTGEGEARFQQWLMDLYRGSASR